MQRVGLASAGAADADERAVHAAQRAAHQRVDRRRVGRRLRRRRLEDAVDLQAQRRDVALAPRVGTDGDVPRPPREALAAARPDCLEGGGRAQPHKAADVARLGRVAPAHARRCSSKCAELSASTKARLASSITSAAAAAVFSAALTSCAGGFGGGTRLPPRRRRGRARRAQIAWAPRRGRRGRATAAGADGAAAVEDGLEQLEQLALHRAAGGDGVNVGRPLRQRNVQRDAAVLEDNGERAVHLADAIVARREVVAPGLSPSTPARHRGGKFDWTAGSLISGTPRRALSCFRDDAEAGGCRERRDAATLLGDAKAYLERRRRGARRRRELTRADELNARRAHAHLRGGGDASCSTAPGRPCSADSSPAT